MTDIRQSRKSITFNPIVLEVLTDEIKRRGWATGYSAIISEVLVEKFNKEVQLKQLEHEKNQFQFQR